MRPTRAALFGLLIVAVGLGLFRLHFDTQVLDLLPPQLKVVEGLKLYQDHFSNHREMILSVRGPSAPVTEAAAASLAAQIGADSNLVETVRWRPAWQEDPTLAAELLAAIWYNQPPATFQELAGRLEETNLPSLLQSAKERLATSFSPTDIARLAYDPFGLTDLPEETAAQIPASMRDQDWFASPDGTYHAMFVQARPPLEDYQECIWWMEGMKRAVAAWKAKFPQYAGITVHYTGPPAFVAETSQGMRRDLTQSITGAMALIGLLFWAAYRRLLPTLWILILLTVIVAGALALGGLFMGALNVVSLGFAGILLGITADYALVLYQSSLAHPEMDATAVQRRVRSGILWSATATAGAFFILRASEFPGLSQLGTMVACGLALGAVVILSWYLPPLLKLKKGPARLPRLPGFTREAGFARTATVAILILTAAGWIWRRPIIDYTGDALQPSNSQAYAALQEMERELNRSEEPFIALVRGTTPEEVWGRLQALHTSLTNAVAARQISSFMLPTLLWPQPAAQQANRATAQWLASQGGRLRQAALTNGFSTNALVLADAILRVWDRAARTPSIFWPTNELSQWILQRVVAQDTNGYLAMGAVYPMPDASAGAAAKWAKTLPQDQTWLTGWKPLAGELLRTMTSKVAVMLVAVILLLAICLRLAFGRWLEVGLGFGALALSGLLLCAIMQMAGWSWNLLNVMALPLLLGAAVDYTILMQLALRRHRGDIAAVHREIGVALTLSCATTAIGFGSLAWAGNGGLASLGRICALGICCAGFIAIFLLPFWWTRWGADFGEPAGPPGMYNAFFWRVGLKVARSVPRSALTPLARIAAWAYWRTQAERREIVVQNLLPAVDGDRAQAELAARRLFLNFGAKMVDLLRCEAGCPAEALIDQLVNASVVLDARNRKNGLLLVTPHLGNWEFGGYILAARNIKLHVVTLAEPGRDLTEVRAAARARNGIETIVIGEDPFAFVQIIKLLQEGAVMALLLDRPTPATATAVELFGRPFRAALAAADLARASGCAIAPVFILGTEQGYMVELLPTIAYDRGELGERAARQELTRQIMQSFEPFIRKFPDQWYHFIPIWPPATAAAPNWKQTELTSLAK
ncbi:MAG TPA: MMPL family transporter [Verrucomicrobiae bacterium]|jgi:predicted exporter/lauroyl/myristoyl acyltransferase|nr:MMPL family transporter [Verrucomicrobiae bacterium]